MCAWLTIYLNHVHTTHQIYFSGNPTNYLLSSFTWAGNLLLVKFFFKSPMSYFIDSVSKRVNRYCFNRHLYSAHSLRLLIQITYCPPLVMINIIHHPAARSEVFFLKSPLIKDLIISLSYLLHTVHSTSCPSLLLPHICILINSLDYYYRNMMLWMDSS